MGDEIMDHFASSSPHKRAVRASLGVMRLEANHSLSKWQIASMPELCIELSIGARAGSVFQFKCYGSKHHSPLPHTATYLTRSPPRSPPLCTLVAFGQSFHLSLLSAAVAATMKYELALTLFDECALLLRKRPP